VNSRTIQVNVLARVEGEGALFLKTQGDEVVEARLRIFEPPRFFEAFLRGRDFREAPDITARICGICPVAYQMGACHAMEDALGVTIDGPIRDLRRLLYCGEWIESHVLHIYMLHAPDFLGYESAIAMAKDYREVVQRGLELKKIGNEIMQVLGGREIHPINVKIGGFYRAPRKEELFAMKERLLWAREASIETVRTVAGFEFPEFSQDYTYVAMAHPDEYPINEGRLISNRGLDIPISSFFEHFQENHVSHSNALQGSFKDGSSYLVGPMARFHLHYDQLTSTCRELAEEAGISRDCTNPFKSIVVRSIEVLYAVEEALRLIEEYEEPAQAAVEIEPKAGVGFGCTEAPRGICLHRYEIDDDGKILDATIVPPTSQNQQRIEEDLYAFASEHLHLDDEQLTWHCEQAIRNYDPCISCATHFLTLEREEVEVGEEMS
jgi:coenzyme F420-reducing hydrogenase alpha subunit